MPIDKARLIELVDGLINVQTSAREKALVGIDPMTAANRTDWQNAKSELVAAIVDYARHHSLPAGDLPRWLGVIAESEQNLGKLVFRDGYLGELRSEFEGLPDSEASTDDAMMMEQLMACLCDAGIEAHTYDLVRRWCKDNGVQTYTRDGWRMTFGIEPPVTAGNVRLCSAQEVMEAIAKDGHRGNKQNRPVERELEQSNRIVDGRMS